MSATGSVAVLLSIALSRRPRAEVAHQMLEVPGMNHPEFGRRKLVEGESQRLVAILDDLALGGPVRPDDAGIEPCYDRVDLRADAVKLIAPDRENPAALERPVRTSG